MSSVMISSRSFTAAGPIARAAAERLGATLLELDDVLREAAAQFEVPCDKLSDAMKKAPSLLGMSTSARRHLGRFVAAAVSAPLLRDHVVLHVPFSALLVQGVAHVLHVRITAPDELRARTAMRLDGLDETAARRRVKADDTASARIARELFDRDDDDDAYDMVADADQTSTEQVAASIVETVSAKQFQPMTYSMKVMRELELAFRLSALLAKGGVDASVVVAQEEAKIRVKAPARRAAELVAKVEALATAQEGIAKADVRIVDDLFDAIAASMR